MSAVDPVAGASYPDLVRRLTTAAAALGGACDSVGDLEGAPIYRLTFGPLTAPPLLIDAGLHGEEPASPLGLAAWLEHDASGWADRIRVTALPCLNPWGFERGVRRSRDAEDLNRLFDQPASPLTRIVADTLAGGRFVLAMDLHEDCDFLSAYCYELKASPPFLAERMMAAAAALGLPVSEGESVGPYTTRHGILRPPPDTSALRGRKGWPIAFHHLAHHTPHVLTLETPGLQPLASRIALQRAALNEAAAFVAGLPPGGSRV